MSESDRRPSLDWQPCTVCGAPNEHGCRCAAADIEAYWTTDASIPHAGLPPVAPLAALEYHPSVSTDGYAFQALVWSWCYIVAARCEHIHGSPADAIACATELAKALPEQHLPKPAMRVIRVDGEIGDDEPTGDVYEGPAHLMAWEMERSRDA